MMQAPLTTRRRFNMLAAASLVAPGGALAASGAEPSIKQIIERVQEKAKPGWAQAIPAGLITGNVDAPVRGIVTTSMATVEVIRQAAKAGANLIFSCEPTFFSKNDGRTVPDTGGWPGARKTMDPNDPILLAKKKLLQDSGITVFRIADHWTSGEDMSRALGAQLGWTSFRSAEDPLRYTIPAASLATVLRDVKAKLAIRGGMRAVGHGDETVRQVAVLAGLRPLTDLLAYLPKTDLVILGETRDWEGPEYSSDANAAGFRKGYAQIGRVVTEDPGMAAFATWLRGFVHEVPVKTIAAKDPYWRPL